MGRADQDTAGVVGGAVGGAIGGALASVLSFGALAVGAAAAAGGLGGYVSYLVFDRFVDG